MKAQENNMVDEMIWSTALCSLVQPTEKKKEHLLDYKSTVWCGFPTFQKIEHFMNFQE